MHVVVLTKDTFSPSIIIQRKCFPMKLLSEVSK